MLKNNRFEQPFSLLALLVTRGVFFGANARMQGMLFKYVSYTSLKLIRIRDGDGSRKN